jgi:hypothetical protein
MGYWAYIDPGSGLLLWQAVVGACLGCVFYVRKSRRWIIGRVQRLFGRAEPKDPSSSITPKDQPGE